MVVLFWLACPNRLVQLDLCRLKCVLFSYPFPAVLFRQSCLGCPVLELFSLAVLAHYLVLAVTVCFDGHLYLSCPGRRVLAFMFRAVLSFLFCTGLPVQADLTRPKNITPSQVMEI
jgi:hypothetical protein